VLPGLSSLPNNQDSDKAVCGAKMQKKVSGFKFKVSSMLDIGY